MQKKNYSSFANKLPAEMLIDDIEIRTETDDIEVLSSDSKSYLENRHSNRVGSFSIQEYEASLILQRLEKQNSKPQESISPLDLLNKRVHERISSTDKLIKTHLSDKKFLESKLPVIQFEELKLISIKIAPSVSYNSVAPSALAASRNLILIGNTNGVIIVFSQSGQELLALNPKKKLGQVTCIDITSDELFAVAGYHFGQLCLWDLKAGKSKKVSTNLHKSPVLSIKFWKGLKDNVISGELSGRVLLIEFQKSLMKLSMNQFELFKDEVGAIVSIDPLYPEPAWPHPTDTNRIVAISGVRKVVIYILEPEIQKIFTVEKPAGTSDLMCPCVSWKLAMAPEDTSPLHHILAIAWGQRIILYTFKFASSEGIQISGYLETDTEIKAVFWLSYEILIGLTRSREIQVITSREFSTKLGESGRRAILEETYANKDLALQLYIKTDKKENFNYHNTLKAQNRVVFLLGNKEFHKGQLLNWKECIDELMKKGEWLEALALGLNLYQGRGKKLYGVPRDKAELREQLKEFVYKFIRVILIPWTIKIAAAIEYCVGIEQLDYLFSSIFDYLAEQHNSQENISIFMNILEPYILNGEIKFIPPEILAKMIEYYLTSKQQNSIERIIVHLEPTCIDPRLVLPACEEHNLLTAYIFINTNSTMQSFVNPLKKLYKTITKQKDPRPKLYFMYKLLWYFRLCLRGETFPNGKVLPEMLNSVVAGSIKWLLKRKHLLSLLQMDSLTTLSVVWQIFEDEIPVGVITSGKESCPSFMDIINKLQEICSPGTFLFHQFHSFILKTANLSHITLNKSIYIDSCKYTLTMTRPSSTSVLFAKDIDEYITIFSKASDKNTLFADFSIEQKGSLLLKLLKKHPLDTKELDELHRFSEISPYTELIIYLLELKKDYSKCVRNFIKCPNMDIKKKVFAWLNQIFKSLSEGEREVLKSDLMISLNELVEIDSDQTARIVTDWYQNKHLEIVRKLNSAPKLQMKYLGELVKDPIDEDLVFKYVVLLCQNDPKKVLPFLEHREDYNFDQCLNECIKYQVVESAAFLHEKLGSVKDALDLLLNRAKNNKNDFLNNNRDFEIVDAIEKDIKQCILLCARNASRLDSTEIEDYLFLVLQEVLELYRDFGHLYSGNPTLEESIHICIKEILEQMMVVLDFNKIITFIIQRFDKIPFKHFKENIFQLLSRHSYQKNIVKRAINLLTNDVKGMTMNLYNTKSRGVNTEENCNVCKSSMYSEKREKIIIFVCGHGYHNKCIKSKICSICSLEEFKGKK